MGKIMFVLNSKSQDNIYETTGLTVEQIADMDFSDIDASISKKVKHAISDYILDERLLGRGQVYAYKKRFITMEEVDRKLRQNDRRKSPFVRKNLPTV